MMLLLSTLALTPSPTFTWADQLGKTWVLTDGWTSMNMALATPAPDPPEEHWIGIVFQPDGTIDWRPLRSVDGGRFIRQSNGSEGCSGAFGGFGGTWSRDSGGVRVELIEYTRGGAEYPASLVVGELEADRMLLKPTK